MKRGTLSPIPRHMLPAHSNCSPIVGQLVMSVVHCFPVLISSHHDTGSIAPTRSSFMPWLSREILILRPPESRNLKETYTPDSGSFELEHIRRRCVPWIKLSKNSLSRSISEGCSVCFIVSLPICVKPYPPFPHTSVLICVLLTDYLSFTPFFSETHKHPYRENSVILTFDMGLHQGAPRDRRRVNC